MKSSLGERVFDVVIVDASCTAPECSLSQRIELLRHELCVQHATPGDRALCTWFREESQRGIQPEFRCEVVELLYNTPRPGN